MSTTLPSWAASSTVDKPCAHSRQSRNPFFANCGDTSELTWPGAFTKCSTNYFYRVFGYPRNSRSVSITVMANSGTPSNNPPITAAHRAPPAVYRTLLAGRHHAAQLIISRGHSAHGSDL